MKHAEESSKEIPEEIKEEIYQFFENHRRIYNAIVHPITLNDNTIIKIFTTNFRAEQLLTKIYNVSIMTYTYGIGILKFKS